MRSTQIISLALLLISGVTIAICKPAFLSGNSFLVGFVNHEFINVLAVMVTVSLVSVVQIHLEYTRIERRFQKRVFSVARSKVNSSALILTSLMIFAFPVSFLRSEFDGNATALSIVFIVSLMCVLEAIFIMYDLIQTVCVMATEEPLGDTKNDPDTNSPATQDG